MKWIYENRLTLMMLLGFFMAVFGCVLIMLSFYVAPIGEIANSVLIAFGEIATFSGSLMGMSATYKSQINAIKNDLKEK